MPVAVPLGGAAERLMHPAVQGVLFAFALTAHVLAWALLAWAAPEVAAGLAGPGPAVAALHAMAVGVLLPTVVGATLQILPVATVQPPLPGWLGIAVAVPLMAGAVALVAGFAVSDLPLVQAGAVLAGFALTLFAGLVAWLVWWVRLGRQGETLAALGGFVVLLLAAVVLAVLTAAGYTQPLLPDPGAAARGHAVIMLFGAMGLLVIGFSTLLLPMLAVADPPPSGSARPALLLVLAAIGLGLAGAFSGLGSVSAAGILCGLGAAGLHVSRMRRVLTASLRRRLGAEFRLVALSWLALVAALLVALGVTLGVLPPRLEALVVLLALHGWLLSLLTGVLQRILPFLASMHTVRACAKPVAVTRLVWAPPLAVHAVCHAAALSLVVVGVAARMPALVQAGGGLGAVGALALAAFGVTVLARALRHARQVGPKPGR